MIQIDSPTTLLFGLAVSLLGVIACLYIIIRSVRRIMGGDQAPRRGAAAGLPGEHRATGAGWLARAKDWLSEPMTPSASGTMRPAAGVTPETRSRMPQETVSHGGSTSDEDAVEVMRVLRVGGRGELIVEADGRRYRRLSDIHDGAVGRRVLLAIQELNGFAGVHAQRALPETHRVGGTEPPLPDTGPEFTPQQREFLADLQVSPAEEDTSQAKPSLVDYWRKGLSRAERQSAAQVAEQEPRSIVEQIDGHLQTRLAARPEMKSRSVHFRSSPTGDLRIEVDGTQFETVDAVADAEIRTLLQAAIEAWEQG